MLLCYYEGWILQKNEFNEFLRFLSENFCLFTFLWKKYKFIIYMNEE